MEPARNAEKTNRTATKNELFSVVRCEFELSGTSSLSPRARRYLFFMISLVRMGFCRISAPMGAISDAIYQSQGQTKSVRTLRSALAELEYAGFLTRRKCRIGPNRSHALIDLHQERFVYWTKIKSKNIIPYPTYDHISSCRQNVPPSDRMRDNIRVNNQNNSVKNIEEPRAHTRSKKSAKKHNYHPIVYTLMCVLPRSPQKAPMIDLAQREISTGTSRQSGIDWIHFSKLWPALDVKPGGRRETTARREIVPLLYAAVERQKKRAKSACEEVYHIGRTGYVHPPKKYSVDESDGTDKNINDNTGISKIREIIGSYLTMGTGNTGKESPKNNGANKMCQPNNLLSRDELEILLPAKEAVKNRR